MPFFKAILILNIGSQVRIHGLFICFHVFVIFPGVLGEIYKEYRREKAEKAKKAKKGGAKIPSANPPWLKLDKVKDRIRNVVKHTNEARKQRLWKVAGASDEFKLLYAGDIAKLFEVRVFFLILPFNY